jgi:hypothetical protein
MRNPAHPHAESETHRRSASTLREKGREIFFVENLV